ncbi:MAG: hypothetical protein LBD30_01605, partial [Verrucomicrobiales bacterium]|nr:hypothetical protein [Verrucomicrobiales bacterium]
AVGARAEVVVAWREQADGSWLDDPQRCPVAPIFRLGVYPLNDLIKICGAVSGVQVAATRLFTGRPTPDNAQLTLTFSSGVIGSVYASFCVENGQHYANTLVLHFERGTIYRNMTPTAYGYAHRSNRLLLVARAGKQQVLTREATFPHANYSDYPWAELRAAVARPSSAAAMPVEEIVHGLEVVAAMQRAADSGRAERV